MVSVKINKISKTIFIPYWYRYGFLEVLLKKNNLTDVLSPFYESDMCYSVEVLFKTAKKAKNHIYTTPV